MIYEINKELDLIQERLLSLMTMEIEIDENELNSIHQELIHMFQTYPKDMIMAIKNQEALVKARKEEIARLKEKNDVSEKVIENFKNTMLRMMEITGQGKIETDIATVSLRKNENMFKVNIINEESIPEEYIKYKKEFDKKTMLNLYKVALKEDGEVLSIPGVEFEKTAPSITIK